LSSALERLTLKLKRPVGLWGAYIVCNLEQMKADKAFTSVRSLIENLIRYAASSECADAWEFSDKQGINVAKDSLKEGFLGLLPKSVSTLYRKSEGFAVRKI
ncbi:hypothetical protein EAY30_21640, partial [Vibrio anguillarum]|uniref:hypothetical protein n=3 Tax=Vibrio anguillarum TaxID=55601 RepID=UPI001BE4259C